MCKWKNTYGLATSIIYTYICFYSYDISPTYITYIYIFIYHECTLLGVLFRWKGPKRSWSSATSSPLWWIGPRTSLNYPRLSIMHVLYSVQKNQWAVGIADLGKRNLRCQFGIPVCGLGQRSKYDLILNRDGQRQILPGRGANVV